MGDPISTGILASTDNPVSEALGLSGKQGAYFKPSTVKSEQTLQGYLDSIDSANRSGAQKYATTLGLGPDASLNDVASQLGIGPEYLKQLQDEQNKLATEGYGLNQNDYEAYGQASGNIARLFGQQEQNLAQSLADRGLGGVTSGVGASQFSGLMGNKNEQLARAQQDIAQNRMQMNQQRLAQTRNFLAQLGNQRTGLVEGQTDRNVGQQNAITGMRANAAQLAQGLEGAQNQGQMASLEDQRNSKGKTLLEGLGSGFMSSAYNVGAAPGSFTQATAGAAGKTAGRGMFGG